MVATHEGPPVPEERHMLVRDRAGVNLPVEARVDLKGPFRSQAIAEIVAGRLNRMADR